MRDDVDRTLDALNAAGIGVFIPFILGLPGETPESLRQAVELAHRLREEHDNIRRMLFSVAVPLAGTVWFEQLCHQEKLVSRYNAQGLDLLNDDEIDYPTLTRLSIEHHCDIAPENLCRTVLDCRSSLGEERVGGFGCLEERIIQQATADAVRADASLLPAGSPLGML
jgi:hypothetical protein